MNEMDQASPRLGWAMYISEWFYNLGERTRHAGDRLRYRTRGIVYYDRVLTWKKPISLSHLLTPPK